MNFHLVSRFPLRRWLSAIASPARDTFGGGLLLGATAVSLWHQWSATFGLNSELQFAVGLVLAFGLWYGPRLVVTETQNQDRQRTYLVLCLCAWTMIQPYWLDTLVTVLRSCPEYWLQQAPQRPLVISLIALSGWIIPAIVWSALFAALTTRRNAVAPQTTAAWSQTSCGVACGLIANSIVLAPLWGVWISNLIMVSAAVALTAYAWWRSHAALNAPDDPAGATRHDTDRASIYFTFDAAIAGLLGALLAGSLRLVDQLLPHGTMVVSLQWAGVLMGLACGFALARFCPRPTGAWAGLLAAAASTMLLATTPFQVTTVLWLNSTMTSVSTLLICRMLLIAMATVPFGASLALVANSHSARTRLAWGTPFAVGVAAATLLLDGTFGVVSLQATCAIAMVLIAGLSCLSGTERPRRVRFAVLGGLAVVALSFPLFPASYDAARAAKLLYSTPTLLAYRFGWDVEYLPYLDDVRMLEQKEGARGPLTLWRGRVAEMYLREAGLPRAIVTGDATQVPQFSPEVLQAVYSMVMVDRPGRVMLLGLSGGVPLSTCLSFPVQEAVCYEGDAALVSMVRGPVARETGFDPFRDERVTLHQVNPELALMTGHGEERFDVILSNPASSLLSWGAPSFTKEFYQRASSQLAERGVFCQRFECVDYGIEPLQMVLKAMRSAFQQVIAIEPTSGEFLLFAANSDDVFIPGDLAARLETSHVCRVLARSGLDWSALLNMPSFDHEVLGEICDESRRAANSSHNCQLAAFTPFEVMRWGNKLQEVQAVLVSTRLTKAPFWYNNQGEPNLLENEIQLTRRSRLVEWLGDSKVSKELVRRLEEVANQQKLVHENPDRHWWAYRSTLRKQLQDRPRAAVQQVKSIDEKQTHPEDIRRQNYFLALGDAATREHPTREQIASIEQFIEPYDPLVSYFARQEIADLLARSDLDPTTELAYRLHVIFFTPAMDASVRNVATAIETLVKHPEAVPNESTRFDALNGLMQTLRVRWEVRQTSPEYNTSKTLDDVNQSVLAIEHGITALDAIASSAGVSHHDWQMRKQVIERLMLRPLRSLRNHVHDRQVRGQAQARAILEEASTLDRPEDAGADPSARSPQQK